MSDPNPHVAALYRAMALRFYARYLDMRRYAEHRGGEFSDHGDLPNQAEADEAYEAAVNQYLWETPESADAVLALVKFAGVLSADRLMGEVTLDPVNDERDAYHQSVALAKAASWLNEVSVDEYLDRHERGNKPGSPKPRFQLLNIERPKTSAPVNEDGAA